MSVSLGDWINPWHLGEEAVAAAAARFAGDAWQTVWFDDFLCPARLEDLRILYETDGDFHPWYYDFGSTSAAQTPESEQELVMRAAKPDRRMGIGYLTHLLLCTFVNSPPFLDHLGRITGIRPDGIQGFQVRISLPGRHVRPHTDNTAGRRLCMVFYPGRRWQPADGGRFQQLSGGRVMRELDPLPNRLVLFKVSDTSMHAVSPLAQDASPRWGFTIWMRKAAAG